MQLIQLLIDGIASGCIYGLVALGFVLIYKASIIITIFEQCIEIFFRPIET